MSNNKKESIVVYNGTIVAAEFGMPPDVTADSVKKVLRKLKAKVHPDKACNSVEAKKAATVHFQNLNEATEFLDDDELRDSYFNSKRHYEAQPQTSLRKFTTEFENSTIIFMAAKTSWKARDDDTLAHALVLGAEERALSAASTLEITNHADDGSITKYLLPAFGGDPLPYDGRVELLEQHAFVVQSRHELNHIQRQRSTASQQRSKDLLAKHRKQFRQSAPPKPATKQFRQSAPPKPATTTRYFLANDSPTKPATKTCKKRRAPDEEIYAPPSECAPKKRKKMKTTLNQCPDCDRFPPGIGCYRHKSEQQQDNISKGVIFGLTSKEKPCETCRAHGHYCLKHRVQSFPRPQRPTQANNRRPFFPGFHQFSFGTNNFFTVNNNTTNKVNNNTTNNAFNSFFCS